MLRRNVENKCLMDVLVRMDGFGVSILSLLLYCSVACEHLGSIVPNYFKISSS